MILYPPPGPRPYLIHHYPEHQIPLGYDAASNCFYVESWPSGIGAQPSAETVAAWVPPAPTPPEVDPVQQVSDALKLRELQARQALLDCKARAAVALVMGGMAEAEAYAAGTDLVLQHAQLIAAYELAGGNPAAKAALIAAIEADPPAWWGPAYLAIFEDAL